MKKKNELFECKLFAIVPLNTKKSELTCSIARAPCGHIVFDAR